ncbi:MAG: FAD-binding oxidoreductase, partial [Betaproteobacteria bacterium]|nr:FAD-binding oxidoreductase [Betaproteobacteria bacterium]
YSNVDGATTAVSSIMAQPVIPCALEFIDKASIDMIRDFSEAELPDEAGALLMIEVDGPESGIDAAVDAVSRAAQNEGLVQLKAASTEAEVAALWATRKALSPALRKIAPNKLNEDIVVPVSRIPDLITGLEGLSQEFGIPIVNFGHAGNGNIHVNLLVNQDNIDEMARAEKCLNEVFDLVIRLNGTLSGEHGIGREKRAYVDKEIDATTLALMKDIKQVFDPNNILNPGKLFL